MTDSVKPLDTTATAQTKALWVADSQHDDLEIYQAEKQAEKFHELLSETSVEETRGSTKDKMARLALLVAQKNLSI